MSPFAVLIDPAEFGLIADYLRNPDSPINYLLHVKTKEMLGRLAEELNRQRNLDVLPWSHEPVEGALRERTALISLRRGFQRNESHQVIDATTIPRRTLCYVIYAPPYYLVHTPGLFEGTVIRAKAEARRSDDLGEKRAPRVKI